MHEIDRLEDLPNTTLSTTEPDVSNTSTIYTCDCERCEDQIAVCYCVDCDHRFCDTQLKVGVLSYLTFFVNQLSVTVLISSVFALFQLYLVEMKRSDFFTMTNFFIRSI